MAVSRLRHLQSVLNPRVQSLLRGRGRGPLLWEPYLEGAPSAAVNRTGQSGFATSASAAAGAGSTASGQAEKLGLSALVLVLPPAITLFLGSWQLQRRQWKMDLLELRSKRLEEPAVPLGTALQEAGAEETALSTHPGEGEESPLEYRRVVCKGSFDESHSLFVGPRVRSVYGVGEKGFYLVTPFIPADPRDHPPVLVNRGWVPSAWRDAHVQQLSPTHIRPSDPSVSPSTDSRAPAAARPAGTRLEEGGQAAGSVDGNAAPGSQKGTKSGWWGWLGSRRKAEGQLSEEGPDAKKAAPPAPPVLHLSGVVRSSELPSSFVPPNVPETGQWFYVDVPRMAEACGLPENALLLDLVKEGTESVKERSSGAGVGSVSTTLGEQETGGGSASQGFPIPKDPSELVKQKVMPQDHLTYAATWYTLSAATGFLAYKRLRARPAQRASKRR